MFGFEVFWYIIVGAAVILYTTLDGFDLGVGMMLPFAKEDRCKRTYLQAIGPVWDGNAVWLIIVGGALFAGFPPMYATLFSAFYMPFMILLAAIIFRAVGIEFRSKVHTAGWRTLWDWVFAISSFVMALLFGVVLGNLVDGIKIDALGVYSGTFWDFLTPYSILLGLLSVSLFVMHGSIYLIMKTEGELHDRVRKWVNPAIVVFIIFYVITTVYTVMYKPHMIGNLYDRPWLFLVAVVALLAIINIPREIKRGKDGFAFLSSLITIASLFAIFGIGTFPVLLRSSLDPSWNITIYNAAATHLTYKVLTIITAIGIPLILAYGFWIYRTFRGKVVLDEKTGY